MKPSTVLLCRHGQTEWNTQGRRQGQLDSPLTSLGRQQAETIAATVQPLGVDTIFVSPQGRAVETATTISKLIDRPLTVVENLAELHHGRYAGMSNQEIENQFPGQLEARKRDKYSWRFPDGESYADVDQRSARALDVIAATGAALPLLVSHEMISRMLLRNLLRLDPAEALAEGLPHGRVLKVNLTREEVFMLPTPSPHVRLADWK